MQITPYVRALNNQNFVQLYAELMSATSPIGNGLIGMLPDPRCCTRSLFFSQRGFYTEAAPGDPVYMVLAINPGTPDPEEVTWLPLCSTDRVERQLDLMYRSLKSPRKRFFFRNLPIMIEELLRAPRDEIFKQVIYTNLSKQSTLQSGQRFERPNNELLRDGLAWLHREIILWQPKGVLVLGDREKARKVLDRTITSMRLPCAFAPHPSARMGLGKILSEIRKARVPLGLGNDTESQHEFPSTELLQASNRSKYPLDAIIHLLVVGNPKRPGTKAYTKFDAFTEGQTVAQYLAAPGNGRNGEIKWCLDHNFISLDERIQEGA